MTSVLSPPAEVLSPQEEADMPYIKISNPVTVDDLESLPDELRYELHEGNLQIMPPATFWHNDVASRITHALRTAGMVATHDTTVKFSEIDTRVPDAAALKSEPDEDRSWFAPSDFLIVVEVVSRSSEDQDRFLKPVYYAKAGIPEYWRVERDPDNRRDALIHQYKLSEDGAYTEIRMIKLSDLEPEVLK